MSELLKPCPWCGQEPVITKIEGQTSVRCESQHCNILPTSMWSDGELEVFEQWNTRAVDTTLIDKILEAIRDARDQAEEDDYFFRESDIIDIIECIKEKQEAKA